MPYQIFALKWRPQNFDQIVGQDHAVNLLKNSIQKGRLAYAYLFAGPRGVGKTSTARILAKALNCKRGPTVNICQECVSCREITLCRSLDVLEIDGASNRGIDEIRALRESVRFAPSSGRFKIYIIDEVHMLTNEAFNALLKTLEEPPEFVKFIFATTQVDRIPATILSRCQRVDFRRIQVVDIINQLKRIVAQEKIKLEQGVLFTIARAAQGSLRDAESILDQLTSFSKDKILISDVSSLLGILEQETLFKIADEIINKDAQGVLNILNVMLMQGKDSTIILNNIIEHFRNLIVAKVSQADAQLIDLPLEIVKRLYTQSERFSLEEMLDMFNILVTTQELSKKMDSSVIPLEINLVRLTREKRPLDLSSRGCPKSNQAELQNQASVSGRCTDRYSDEGNSKTHNHKIDVNLSASDNKITINHNKRGKLGLSSSKVDLIELDREREKIPMSSSVNPAVMQNQDTADINRENSDNVSCGCVKDASAALKEIKRCWAELIEILGKTKMSVATFLSEGKPLKLENDLLTISFSGNCSLHKEALQKRENKLLIEKTISQFLNNNLRVNFILSVTDSKEDVEDEKRRNDSFIHSAINAFNARLI